MFDSAVSKRLDQIKTMDDFPMPKGPALALIRLTQREFVSLAVVAHAIKADPTFAVRVIKVANAVCAADHGPVVSLRDAVDVMGVPAVRSLATGFSLLENYRGAECAHFDGARFWSQSLARAIALQLLAGTREGFSPADAFSVGLLARIGELVFATLFAKTYDGLLQRRPQQSGTDFTEAERLAFAVTHGELTASVLLDYNLPEVFAKAVDLLDQSTAPESGQATDAATATQLLALADHIGSICVAAPEQWRTMVPHLVQLGAAASIDAEALGALCDRAAHEWREWGTALELETGPMPCFVADKTDAPAAPPAAANVAAKTPAAPVPAAPVAAVKPASPAAAAPARVPAAPAAPAAAAPAKPAAAASASPAAKSASAQPAAAIVKPVATAKPAAAAPATAAAKPAAAKPPVAPAVAPAAAKAANAPVAAARPASAKPAGAEQMRILLVGDAVRVRKPLCQALEDSGYRLSEADNGRAGLATAIELQPQIMLIDVMASEIDGFELTRTLRQFKAGRSIHVLLLTDRQDDDKLIRAFEAGADGLLVMPVEPRLLAAYLLAGKRAAGLQDELRRDQEEVRRISAELSASNQKLLEAGMTDVLTGCPNRRSAMERINQEWAMATRSERPLACMVIDVDNMKQINDEHGHEAGDAALKLLASAIKEEMRAQDVLARSGGDEFLVICPDTTLEAALACAERMRSAAAAQPIVGGAQPARGSVSIGVAVRDASTADSDALIRLADEGAYLAKRRRNAVATVQSRAANSARSA